MCNEPPKSPKGAAQEPADRECGDEPEGRRLAFDSSKLRLGDLDVAALCEEADSKARASTKGC
jgi:hypothetical protein